MIFGITVPSKLLQRMWQSELQRFPNYSPSMGYVTVSNKDRYPTVYGGMTPVIFPTGFNNPIKAIINDQNRLLT